MGAKKRTPQRERKPQEKPASPSRPVRLRPPRIFQYVDAVARHGSIRKAAESLHVVSSALNRRILDLEDELGTSLFERLPRGVRPTAAASCSSATCGARCASWTRWARRSKACAAWCAGACAWPWRSR